MATFRHVIHSSLNASAIRQTCSHRRIKFKMYHLYQIICWEDLTSFRCTRRVLLKVFGTYNVQISALVTYACGNIVYHRVNEIE